MRGTIERQLANPDVQVIITTGGTGITSRDSTFEAVIGLLEKRLDGFGELFRMLSYEQIGVGRDDEPRLRRPGRRTHRRRRCRDRKRPCGWRMETLLIPELGHLVQQAR